MFLILLYLLITFGAAAEEWLDVRERNEGLATSFAFHVGQIVAIIFVAALWPVWFGAQVIAEMRQTDD